MHAVMSVSVSGLPEPREGKVCLMYDLGDKLLAVRRDCISAFDVVMKNGIPDKGKVLNQMSAFWFQELEDVCPHHMITIDDDEIANSLGFSHSEFAGRSMLCKKAKPLTIECVARGYIAGSLLKDYKAQGPNVYGLGLPLGLIESSELSEPIFTPATKAQTGHDENISFAEAIDRVGRETAELVRDWTLELYRRAAKKTAEKGILLADTKFEFGETEEGIIWIDEALTPDSSRFWPASSYQPGRPQPSYDKQFVRDYLESIGFDKEGPGVILPPEIVEKTREKYLEAYRLLTGRELAA